MNTRMNVCIHTYIHIMHLLHTHYIHTPNIIYTYILHIRWSNSNPTSCIYVGIPHLRRRTCLTIVTNEAVDAITPVPVNYVYTIRPILTRVAVTTAQVYNIFKVINATTVSSICSIICCHEWRPCSLWHHKGFLNARQIMFICIVWQNQF